MHRLYELAPAFRLEELPPGPPLGDAAQARIAAIWEDETRRRGSTLFDGPVYSLVEHAPERLAVRRSSYRHLMAWRRDPGLAAEGLVLRPIGVTGLLLVRGGVVFGRRAGHVAADAGLWETAPSGGLDRLDAAGLILEELQEELGLPASAVSPPRAIALVEDTTSGVFDIVFRLETALDAPAVLAAHRDSGSDEYSELAVVAPQDLARFLAAHPGGALPIVPAILERAGLLS